MWTYNFDNDIRRMKSLEKSLLSDGRTLERATFFKKKNNLPFFICLKFKNNKYFVCKAAGHNLSVIKTKKIISDLPLWAVKTDQKKIESARREFEYDKKHGISPDSNVKDYFSAYQLSGRYLSSNSKYLYDIDSVSITDCLDSAPQEVGEFIMFNLDLFSGF